MVKKQATIRRLDEQVIPNKLLVGKQLASIPRPRNAEVNARFLGTQRVNVALSVIGTQEHSRDGICECLAIR